MPLHSPLQSVPVLCVSTRTARLSAGMLRHRWDDAHARCRRCFTLASRSSSSSSGCGRSLVSNTSRRSISASAAAAAAAGIKPRNPCSPTSRSHCRLIRSIESGRPPPNASLIHHRFARTRKTMRTFVENSHHQTTQFCLQYNTIQYKICKAPCFRGFRGAGEQVS